MFKSLADLFSPRTQAVKRPRKSLPVRRPRLGLDALEDRRVPTTVSVINPIIVLPPPPGISLGSSGTLSIVGDDRDTDAEVRVEGGKVKVTLTAITWKQVGLGSVVPIASTTEAE